MAQRQEVLNVKLAELLQDRGAVVAPETIEYTGKTHRRQMPDVIVSFRGLRTAIEGEIDASQARKKSIESANARVETGLAHIGIGVVYPEFLRHTDFASLKEELSKAQLDIAVTTEAETTEFSQGNVDYLERLLRSTFEQLVQEDVVADSVELLDVAVDNFANSALAEEGNSGRIAIILNGDMTNKELAKMTQKQHAANCRIGGLVLLNAMIFHDVLARHQPRLSPLRNVLAAKNFDIFISEWQYILENINYYAIFSLARNILLQISRSTPGMIETLAQMVRTSAKISERRAALRHDLMGRVYHRLLAEAKYLGTYYTSIPAATMLLKLSIQRDQWNVDWSNPEDIQKLKIADLSCGTGTLLMAAADSVIDNHVSTAAKNGSKVQLEATHHAIAEKILHGYDVLPSAIHLTASTLSMRTPDIPLKKMNLFSLPLGGTDNSLGSIELLQPSTKRLPFNDLFGAVETTQQITGKEMQNIEGIPYPMLDLCVMNPPFVRSVGGNLLFGSMPDKQRPKMQKRLKNLVKSSGARANITAGLGSVFIAVGDRRVKIGGRLSLILPKALLSGYSWGKSRQLINSAYRLEYIIVSHDAERWNFSDSTDLSEVLVIATKLPEDSRKDEHSVTIVNLWRNPTKALEALSLTEQILQSDAPNLLTEPGAARIELHDEPAGEIVKFDWKELKNDWFFPTAFAQSDLTRVAYQLKNSILKLPTSNDTYDLPLAKLENLGVLGPDRRDIYDGFETTDAPTPYPAFWGHDADEITTVQMEPNLYLNPLKKAKKGRNLRDANNLWKLSGKILLAERMWLKTQRLTAIYVSQPVLANVWWSFAIRDDIRRNGINRAIMLWLNSTLGLINLIATRDETRGAWVDFKKPSLRALPILDVRKLSEVQIATLVDTYDEICDEEILPLPSMATDKTREKIDSAISEVLGLPDLSILRKMLAREPVVCMERIG